MYAHWNPSQNVPISYLAGVSYWENMENYGKLSIYQELLYAHWNPGKNIPISEVENMEENYAKLS